MKFRLVFLLALVLVACDQKLPNELGPSVDCISIEKAINGGLTGTFDRMELGQFVNTQSKYFTFNSPWVVYQDMSDLIVEVYTGAQGKELHLLRTIVNYSNGQAAKPETKHIFGLATADYPFCPEKPDSSVTFHNLKITEATERSPSSTCQGSACQIKARTVQFDILDRRSGGEERSNYLMKVSPDAPYLARFLSQCSTSKQNVNGIDVPVTQCTDVTDFGKQAN